MGTPRAMNCMLARSSRRLISKASPACARIETHSINTLIMGRPGGGKGTISKKMLKDFNYVHVSTGDLLRANVRDGTDLGKEAKSYMDTGSLVPDDLIIRLVVDEVSQHADKSLLLDGFPRTLAQGEAIEAYLPVDNAIYLNVPTQTIVERISNRWIHPGSGRIYAYDYNPPKVEGKDDETREPLIQRDDDKPEAVGARLQQYDDMTLPLVGLYEKQGKLAEFQGTESDVIYPKVKDYLDGLCGTTDLTAK